MKFGLWFWATTLLAASIVTLPAGAQEAAPAAATVEPPIPTVSVVSADQQTISAKVIVTGTLVAREQVLVTPGVDGLKIETILVDAGDRVQEGDVLARLAVDTIDIQLAQNRSQLAASDAQIAQARAQIASAEASLTQATAALDRARTLTQKGVSAQDVLDQRQAVADQTAAQLAVARETLTAAEAGKTLVEAQRAELELRLSKTEIKAPKAGLILSRTAVVGQVAAGSGGALFVIAEDGDIELDADVTETVLPKLAVGQAVTVLPAGLVEPVSGTVRLVLPEINASTRLGKARVALPADAGLRVGAFARGTVEIAESHGIVLPVTAISSEGGVASVQVVKDGVVDSRPVVTGISDAGLVEVTQGLATGEMVVAKAGTFLRGGDKVKPQVVSVPGVKG